MADPIKTEEELQAEKDAAAAEEKKKKEASPPPADVYESTKADMFKYKGQRNELRDQNQELTKELNEIKEEKKKADDAKLLEDGEFKELAEKREIENKQLIQKNNDTLVNSEIKVEALRIGAKDVNDIITLFDKSQITISESGIIEGVVEAMKSFQELKPHLFGTETPSGPPPPGKPPVDTGKPGSPPADKKYEDLKPSELMKLKKDSPELYNQLEAEHDQKYKTESPSGNMADK